MIGIVLLWLAPPLMEQIAKSGRVLEIGEHPSARVTRSLEIAPGLPPVLAFRAFEGRAKHRFGNLDLILDDAGH